MRTSAADWKPIDTVPRTGAIEILYMNTTFDPPAMGVIKNASANRKLGFWLDEKDRGVPMQFAVSWRPAPVGVRNEDAA